MYRTLGQFPVFAKPGAIVPLADYDARDNRLLNADTMEVLVFPGADGEFTLYEDAGEGSDYRSGAFVQTKLSLHWGENAEFTIAPAQGDLSLIPTKRTWKIGLRGWQQDAAQGEWNAESNTLWVTVTADVTQPVTLSLAGKVTDNERLEAEGKADQAKSDIKDKISDAGDAIKDKANEAMGHAWAHIHALPVTMFRFFTVYGPWGRPDMAPMLFARAISHVHGGTSIADLF